MTKNKNEENIMTEKMNYDPETYCYDESDTLMSEYEGGVDDK